MLCYFHHVDVMELLLTRGANPNLISDEGRTVSDALENYDDSFVVRSVNLIPIQAVQ